jgi:hypothetical protein
VRAGNAQIVLVGAREGGADEAGLEAEHESARSAEIFRQLRFARSRHPVEPLLEGEWR